MNCSLMLHAEKNPTARKDPMAVLVINTHRPIPNSSAMDVGITLLPLRRVVKAFGRPFGLKTGVVDSRPVNG